MSPLTSPARSASVATVLLLFSIALIGRTEYGQTLLWSLTRMVAVVLFLVCCVAHRHAGMTMRGLGAVALCFSSLSGALAFIGAHAAVSEALFVAVASVLFLIARRLACVRFGQPAAALGGMCALLIALVILTFTLPSASYLLAWPMLAAMLAFGAGLLPGVSPRQRNAISIAALLPAGAMVTPFLTSLDTLPAPMRAIFLSVGLAALFGCGAGLLPGIQMRSVTRGWVTM